MDCLEPSTTLIVGGEGEGVLCSLPFPGRSARSQLKAWLCTLASGVGIPCSAGSDPQGCVRSPSPPSQPGASPLQVDDLKAKLATQEAELKRKTEDADQLIQEVGVETDKVSREKAAADEEERKVALIMLEVRQKQKDCEEDLAKAEPALTAAQAALNTLNKVGCLACCLPLGGAGSSSTKAAGYPGAPKGYKGRVGEPRVESSSH